MSDRDRFVDFAMNRVRMLMHFGVRPYLVFDGDYLPSKSGTEKDRAARRRESKKTGLELLRVGKTSQAHLELQKAVDVTPEMARQLMEELKKAKVDFVVAPFEADSQLAYLERQGIIHGILSEDSDLLVFGVKCLLTKLDQYGDCIEINRSDFTACREVSLVGWSDVEFRCMAIMSGCDYLQGIEKMGLKTAHRLIRKHKSVDRIIRSVQFDGKMKVPAGYLDAFRQAERTFLYQWVFCPRTKRLVNLTEPESDIDVHKLPYIGHYVEPTLAAGVARGDLHPHTKEPIVLDSRYQHSMRPPQRSQSLNSTPWPNKSNKSIGDFFKPRRTPLAELDPNSFTPSPSQQRLLQQHPVSWSAEPITARPALVRAATAITGSAPQPPRRTMSDAWSHVAGSPPKKQRLCSDQDVLRSSNSTTRTLSGPSRFFAVSDSPSLRKGTKTGKGVTEKFNLWSDDSVEEALAQLPDDTQPPTARSKRKMSVFVDDQANSSIANAVAPSESESQPVTTGSSRTDSQNTTVTETTSFSSVGEHSDDGTTLFSASLSASVSALRAKYSFNANEDDAGLPVKAPSVAKRTGPTPTPENAGLEAYGADTQGFEEVPCSSPLAHMPGESTRLAKDSQRIRSQADGSDYLDFGDAELLAMESQTVASAASGVNLKGSEDLIVPDSEGEEEEAPKPGLKLDLARFAFAG